MKSGDLAQAVRASAAVPLLFAPERRDGRFLADGGLSANMPVAVARAEGADRVIVVDATEHPSDSVDAYSPLLVADRLVQFLFQQRADSLGARRPARPARRRGVHQPQLRPPEHRAADRSRRRRRRLGAAPLRLPRAAPSPARRARSRRGSPAYRMTGANASEQLALTRLLALDVGPRDTLDFELLRTRVRSLATASEAYESVWLTPTGAGDSVTFDLVIRARRAPRRRPRPRLRQRARRADVGGHRGPPVARPRAGGKRRALPRRASARARARRAAELSGRPAALQSRRSPCGSPTRTSGGSTRTGKEVGAGVHPRGRRLRRHRAAAARTGGMSRSAPKAGCGTSPAAPDRSTARRRGPRHRRDPAAWASARRRSCNGPAMYQRAALEGVRRRRGSASSASSPRHPARLGRRAAPPARLPAGRRRRLPRAITSASAAATARRCWACSSRSRSRGRCSRESNWPAAGPTPRRAAFRAADGLPACAPGVGAETPVGPVRFEYGLALRGRDALVRAARDGGSRASRWMPRAAR